MDIDGVLKELADFIEDKVQNLKIRLLPFIPNQKDSLLLPL
jgi:pyruvate-formate lyase-activating enzyme